MQKNSLDPKTIQGVWHVVSFSQPRVHFHVRNGRVGMGFQYVYYCLLMGCIEFGHHISITFLPVNIGSKKTLPNLSLQYDGKVTVLMGRATITYVNIILSQYRMTAKVQGLFEIASPVSSGPWIPIIPSSQQNQNLDEQWQEEDED